MSLLRNVRILDLSRLLPGPTATWYLAGMGAEVIKVEPPTGDPLRAYPPRDSVGMGKYFRSINAGKKSVVIDFRDPTDIARLVQMVSQVDVVVEGFRPGVMARMGLDPDALVRAHPRLILCSISGYGQSGEWADRPGHDLGYVSMTGALSLGHQAGGRPHPPAVQMADVMGGAMAAAMQICAALFHRERTGEGARLDISMTEQALAFVAPHLPLGAAANPPGKSTLTGGLANYDVYRCADGRFLAVSGLEPKFVAMMREVLGVEPTDRQAMALILMTRPRDAWDADLGMACVTPVLTLDEVGSHPLHASRQSVVCDDDGCWVVPPVPGAAGNPLSPAPDLGAHTENILEEMGVS